MKEVTCDLCGYSNYIVIATRGRYNEYVRNVICKRCGLVYQNPIKKIGDYYSSGNYRKTFSATEYVDEKYLKWANLYADWRIQFIRNFMKDKNKVLEIGCSEGTFLFLLKKSFPQIEITGVEHHIEFANFGRKVYNLNIITDSFERCSLQDNSFDIVCLWHVLEHMQSPTYVLKKIWKILTDSGFLIIETPSITLPYHSLDYFFQVPHFFTFSPKTMSLYLKKSGFDIVHFEKARSPDYSLGDDNIRIVAKKTNSCCSVEIKNEGDSALRIIFFLRLYQIRYLLFYLIPQKIKSLIVKIIKKLKEIKIKLCCRL